MRGSSSARMRVCSTSGKSKTSRARGRDASHTAATRPSFGSSLLPRLEESVARQGREEIDGGRGAAEQCADVRGVEVRTALCHDAVHVIVKLDQLIVRGAGEQAFVRECFVDQRL